MPPDAPSCDLAVWDLHGGLTTRVRDELRSAVRHTAPKLETLCGQWRDRQVAVGWPRRVTRVRLPLLREAVSGLLAGHRPRRLVLVGPAAAGESGVAPGQAAKLGETAGVVTRWEAEARKILADLEAEAVLLAAITRAGSTAPPIARPTTARQAGRWLGQLMGSSNQETDADATQAVAEALATLITNH